MQEYIRVSEVADLLSLIADPPNCRDRPIEGDLDGDFDFWFDGGACKDVTGDRRYVFKEGHKASMPTTPGLVVSIKFADGRSVQLIQEV